MRRSIKHPLGKLLALTLVLLLSLSSVALAEPAWVARYEKTIRSTYKRGSFEYWGLADLGTDDTPEMFLTTGRPGKQQLRFYYITKGGSVRRSSKYIPIKSVYNDFTMDIYDEHGYYRNIAVITGSHYSSRKVDALTYQLSQNARKTLWLQNIAQIKGLDISGDDEITRYTKFYWKGRKVSAEKFARYFEAYRDTICGYTYMGTLSRQYHDSVDSVIASFRRDALRFY